MISVSNLSKIYNKDLKNELIALDSVNLDIQDGELVAITGKSGSGKSTLLHIMSCIDRFDKGTIKVDGHDVTHFSNQQLSVFRNEKIGIILQDFALIDSYTVLENVTIPLYFSKSRIKNKKDIALEILASVGMETFQNTVVSVLSGGEKQRVAIARALVNNPSYIFADEPTGSLDSENSSIIFNLLKEINQANKTVIIVTHDQQLATQCQRIITLEDGRII